MNRRLPTTSTRPVKGQGAFVRAAAMSFVGTCGGYPYAQHLAALKRPQWNRADEGDVHPGEGSA